MFLLHLFQPGKGVEGLRVEFDRQCSTEKRHDPLIIMDSTGRTVSVRSGVYLSHLFIYFITLGVQLNAFNRDSFANCPKTN